MSGEIPHQSLDTRAEKRAQVLRQRAQALARNGDSPHEEPTIRVVEFSLGTEKYAFEMALVDEVFQIRDLAPLPGAPAFVLGITYVRGEMVSVLDLQLLFGASPGERPDTYPIIVLRSAAMKFAIAADSVGGMREIPEEAVERFPSAGIGIRDDYLLGVTAEGVAVLDPAGMLSDPRIIVGDRMSALKQAKGNPT